MLIGPGAVTCERTLLKMLVGRAETGRLGASVGSVGSALRMEETTLVGRMSVGTAVGTTTLGETTCEMTLLRMLVGRTETGRLGALVGSVGIALRIEETTSVGRALVGTAVGRATVGETTCEITLLKMLVGRTETGRLATLVGSVGIALRIDETTAVGRMFVGTAVGTTTVGVVARETTLLSTLVGRSVAGML